MPYVGHETRRALRREIEDLSARIDDLGELCYAVTKLVHNYLLGEEYINYHAMTEAIGVLETAKLELYRAVVGPYEDEARARNGAVSELEGL